MENPLPVNVMLEIRKEPGWEYIKLLLVDKKHNCDLDQVHIPLTELTRETDLQVHVNNFKDSLYENGVV